MGGLLTALCIGYLITYIINSLTDTPKKEFWEYEREIEERKAIVKAVCEVSAKGAGLAYSKAHKQPLKDRGTQALFSLSEFVSRWHV